jgi:hypothetical protein
MMRPNWRRSQTDASCRKSDFGSHVDHQFAFFVAACSAAFFSSDSAIRVVIGKATHWLSTAPIPSGTRFQFDEACPGTWFAQQRTKAIRELLDAAGMRVL